MGDQDETTQILGSQTYRSAYDAVMTGTEIGALPDDQRDAVRRAREVTGTAAPGLPAPLGLDPTRPVPGGSGEPGRG